jgi:5S rRNA maturation endonuclease (ribonuclease M5)
MQLAEFLSHFQNTKPADDGQWSARCPAHDDNRASLGINQSAPEHYLVNCLAGCQVDAVLSAAGLKMQDLFPPKQEQSRIVATYDYRDESGALLFQTVRFEPKDFRQRVPTFEGGWSWKLGTTRRVLYRLPELVAADPLEEVNICEGEKDCDRLASLGLLATTNPMGASKGKSKWLPGYSESLRGRHVVILPDNDEPGRKHAETVAVALHGIAASVKVVELPGLPVKGDVSDWLDAGGTVARLGALVDELCVWEPVDLTSICGKPESSEAVNLGPADPGHFPEHLLKVPGFLGEVIDFNLQGAFKPQPILALAGALCLLAVLTGRKITDVYGTRTNLYCLGVCESGWGKDRARVVNKDILLMAGLERMIGPESIGSSAGLASVVEQEPSLLIQLDEIGRILKTLGDARQSHLYNIVTVLMKMFTSSASLYIGDAYADTKRIKRIYQPHVCLYGTTVPQSFYESMTTESLTDGFLARTLVFEASDSPRCSPVATVVPDSLISQANQWGMFKPGGDLGNQIPQPIVIPMIPDADAALQELEQLAERERSLLGDPFGPMWGRSGEKARKLALLRAVSAGGIQAEITRDAAEWAISLIDYLTRRSIFLASRWIASSSYEGKAKRVLRLIEDAGAGGISKTDLNNKIGLPMRERGEIIADLDERDLIYVVNEQEDRRGRPTTRYVSTKY